MNAKVCIRMLADTEQINRCRNLLSDHKKQVAKTSQLLALAGNEIRFKILYLLHVEKELCVCDLSDILQMNISAVSQHLRKLKDGRLVDIRKEGQTYFYFLKETHKIPLEILFSLIESNKYASVIQ